MAITFRPDRIVPIDCLPGAGLVSPLWDSISAIAADVGALTSDAAHGTLQPPAVAAVESLRAVHRAHWQIADGVAKQMAAPATKGLLTRATTDAVERLPKSGWFAGSALYAAQAAERTKILRSFQRDVSTAVIQGKSGKLATLATSCVEALGAFGEAIGEAAGDADAPSALDTSVSLEDLAKRADCENEILAMGPDAMARSLVMFEEAVRHGKTDRLKNMVPAIVRAANQLLLTPRPQLAARRATFYPSVSPGPHEDTPQTTARRVLAAIRAYKESQRPSSIAEATNILTRMRPIFATLLGRDAPEFLSTDQLLGRARGGDAAHVGLKWEVSPTWASRYAPPAPIALPGWSPIVMFTDGRVPVREPGPDPLVPAEVR